MQTTSQEVLRHQNCQHVNHILSIDFVRVIIVSDIADPSETLVHDCDVLVTRKVPNVYLVYSQLLLGSVVQGFDLYGVFCEGTQDKRPRKLCFKLIKYRD